MLRQAVVAGLGPASSDVGGIPRPPGPTLTGLYRGSATAPFAVIFGTLPTWAVGHGAFGAASVWVSAALLSANSPAGSWVGFAVSAGTIRGIVSPGGTPDKLIVAPGSRLVLSLTLAAPPQPGGTGPGGDARAATIQLPQNVELVFGDTQCDVAELGNGQLSALGASLRLAHAGAAPGYAADISRLLIPMTPDPGSFTVSHEVSTLVTLTGGGALQEAGWALPVTVSDPAQLGSVADHGSLAVNVAAGTSIAWQDQPQPVALGQWWLLAAPGQLTVASGAAVGSGVLEQLALYPPPSGRGVGGLLRVALADEFGLIYECDASGLEILLFNGSVTFSLDRPVTVTGSRIAVAGQATLGLLQQAETTELVALVATGTPGPAAVVALDNALLNVTGPDLVLLAATLTAGGAVQSGTVIMSFPLGRVVPILPDPYAANITAGPVAVTQQPAAVQSAPARVAATAIPVIGAPSAASVAVGPAVQARVDWDNNASGGPQLTFALSSPTGEVGPPPGGSASAVPAAVASTDAGLLADLAAASAKALDSEPGGYALLDVSTAADLFGVRFGPPPAGAEAVTPDALLATVTAPAAADPIATITGLDVAAPAHRLRIITVPAVQWEPIDTPDATGSFSPMTFADSGGETQLASRSVRLVPVAPVPALQQMVGDFNADQDPVGAVASLTFPFGMRAAAYLNPIAGLPASGAQVDLHRPQFSTVSVTGGYQVRAAAFNLIADLLGESVSFPGAMVQLSNGLHNGSPTGLSPIDPLTGLFNDEFAPGGFAQQVPVESFEISGYGETAFTNWIADNDDPVSFSQVRFDVATGRTIVEVVQARSIAVPFAPRFIRTIKMIRDNSGRVYRIDSGWQPVTDGIYAWPRSDVRTHPGVVLGITHITNIRDTGQRWTSSKGTQLGAVRYDCMVQMDGVIAGATADGVPSHDQLGFVQLTSMTGNMMGPDEFAELLAAFGPLGGAVDCVLNLGGTGQGMRVSWVGVGATQGATGPEFAMAAWGSPVLPQGGQWSVVVQPAGSASPQPVNPSLGVPVIRAGYAGSPADPASPFRLADPQDLDTPTTPAADYGLLHSWGTQRVLFPRPKVELTGPRATAWSSTQPPVLADPYDLATAVGLFPDAAHTIPFPDADYGLEPRPGGGLALNLAHNDFHVTGGDHVLHDNGHVQVFARYKDESAAPSTVHLEIDSTQPVPWVFRLEGVEIGVSTTGLGEIMRLLGSIHSSAVQPTVLTSATTHFGSVLAPVQDLIGFLGSTPAPTDMPFAQRNQPSLEVTEAFDLPDINLGILTLEECDLKLGWKLDLANAATSAKVEFESSASGSTPFPPLQASGQFKLDMELHDTGASLLLTVGLGIGADFDIGPFKAEANFYNNFYILVGDTSTGLGTGVELKGEVDLVVASVEVDIEARGLVVHATCNEGLTVWLIAQVSCGLEVSIAWVINIDFEYQAQWQDNMNGGPCPAPNP